MTAAIVAFLLAPPNTGASNRPSEPLLSPPPLSGSIPQAEKTPIVFGELNWESVALQTRIAQYIVEMGYGYPTQAAFGESVPPLIQALGTGEVDVLMEVWLPPSEEFNSLVNNGEAVSLGESLSKDWQSAFVIPAYLQQQYPQLDHVNDLKTPQFQALFATPASGGKALLVSCAAGWACESANSAQITAYGLSAHVTSTNPISQNALFDSVFNAYEQGDPWLGHMWRTAEPALLLNLVRLEEPAYTSQCWATDMACAYQDSTVLIGANANLPTRAPDVAEMLRRWNFDTDTVYRPIYQWWNANPGAGVEATALWWLKNNRGLWSQWVTDNAEQRIRRALTCNTMPTGWNRNSGQCPPEEPYDPKSHPEVYVNEPHGMSVSCESVDGGTNLAFDLGTYNKGLYLWMSYWHNDRYATFDYLDFDTPTLVREGQTATVLVTTDPAKTRFHLDSSSNIPITNLLLGYADCHTD